MMRALLLAALAFATPAAAQDEDPLWPRDEPRFSFTGLFAYYGSMCDCDTRDLVLRTLAPISGHAEPDPSSPVVRTVAANRLIEGNDWDVEVTVVESAPTTVLRRPLQVREAQRMTDPRRGGWGDGPETTAFTLPAGTRLTSYDSYGDSGYFHADGVTYYGTIPSDEEEVFVSEVKSSRWWRLVPRNGGPAAWVKVSNMADESRSFEQLCETHDGCVSGFTPSYQPNR